MKNYKQILEAINRGIKFALDDYEDNELQGQINSKVKYKGGTKEYLDLMNKVVDLGLPSGTLWSKFLLGATNGDTKESWYGNYYAWGETETKLDYNWTTYKYANDDYDNLTKYCNNAEYSNDGFTDNLTQLVPEDDVAMQTNSAWKIPTKEDFDELIAGTTNRWVTNYNNIEGLNGRVFTSKVNGNTLFIPAAGFRGGSDISNVGSCCYLSSSSLNLYDPNYAYYLYFDSDYIGMHDNNRCYGFSVRPVC